MTSTTLAPDPMTSTTRRFLRPGPYSLFILCDNGTWTQPTVTIGDGWTVPTLAEHLEIRHGGFTSHGLQSDPGPYGAEPEPDRIGDAPDYVPGLDPNVEITTRHRWATTEQVAIVRDCGVTMKEARESRDWPMSWISNHVAPMLRKGARPHPAHLRMIRRALDCSDSEVQRWTRNHATRAVLALLDKEGWPGLFKRDD